MREILFRGKSIDSGEWLFMESSKSKICPLSMRPCKEHSCAWWHGLAEDCAVMLLAGMFADKGGETNGKAEKSIP